MVASEIAFIEQLFETAKADLSAGFREEMQHLHKRLDVAHDKLNTALSAISHIILGVKDMSADHASILADLKAFDADLDTKVDGAVSEFESFVSTHTAVQESLDDIGTIVAGLPAKLAKLDVIKEPDAGTPASASTGTSTASTAPSDPVTSTGTTSAGVPVTSVVDPAAGTTTASTVDPSTGASTSTVLDHTTGTSTTTDASGQPVATDPAVHDAAMSATAAAGVAVPSAS